MKTETVLCVFILCIALALPLAVLVAFTPPTEAQIAKCVEVTNYTAERCVWEITR